MGFGILLSGLAIVCVSVFYVIGKSKTDKNYQPKHIKNQEEIDQLINKKIELKKRIKEDRELSAQEIHRVENEINRLETIIKSNKIISDE